ncbi:hypothetical protein [Sphingomonas sp. BK345]|uniref:hypothetical protein n=1 Tax=Sphingomonas sp. BK345 TaxID=2586980 RepID=UPI001611DC5E|nr:hypothetical protein [Sphingomonas sp. BK345]MBB3475892.1 hypothetical protein [Sphingomonas sp. BK345]
MTNPPPSLVTWFLSLEHAPQAVLLVGIGTVTVAFLAFCATLLSAISAWRSARVAAAQAETSLTTLFVSLLPRRLEWLDEFRTAVAERQHEIAFGMNPDAHGMIPDPVALFKVSNGRRAARNLFDDSVSGIASQIEKLLERKTRLIIQLHSRTDKVSATDLTAPGDIAVEIDAKLGELFEHCRPFLYVGDVKRSSKTVRVAKRIKGWVRWPLARSTRDRDLSEVRRP